MILPVQKENFSGPRIPNFQVRRAGNFFGCQAEFELNNGLRAEFRAE